MQKILIFLTTSALLGGCQTVSDHFVTPGICQANSTERLIGQQHLTGEQIMQISNASTVRVLKSGQAATMDYRAERVTVIIDAEQKIIKASCG